MESKVNTRFVVILITVVIALFGLVAFVGMKRMQSSASENFAQGVAAYDEGDYKQAVIEFSQAVNKDQENVEYLTRWIDAMERRIPESRSAYFEAYNTDYRSGTMALALASEDIAPKKRVMEDAYTRFRIANAPLAFGEEIMSQCLEYIDSYGDVSGPHEGLHRYPGLIGVALLQGGIQRNDEQIEAAREHLEKALAFAPDDEESAVGLALWHQLRGERLRRDRLDEEAEAVFASAKQRMEDFISTYDPAPRMRMALFGLTLGKWSQEQSGTYIDGQSVYEAHKPMVDALYDSALRSDAAKMEPLLAVQLARRLAQTGDMGLERAIGVLDHALTGQPDNAALMIEKGVYQRMDERPKDAMKTFQAVTELPNLPLSLDGLMRFDQRDRAILFQCETALQTWQDEETVEAKQAALDQAKTLRQQLIEEAGEDYDKLLLLDARIAFADGEYNEAKILVNDYNAQTNERDIAALILQGEILKRTGNMGGARDQYERVLELQSGNATAIANLAEIYRQLSDWPTALGYYRLLAQIDPTDESIQQQIETLEGIVRPTDGIMRVLVEAQAVLDDVEGDMESAIDMVREAIDEYGPEPRLSYVYARNVRRLNAVDRRDDMLTILRDAHAATPEDYRVLGELVQALVWVDDNREEALQHVDAALVRNPGNSGLETLKESLLIDDPLAEAMRRIDEDTNTTEFHKAFLRYQAEMQFGSRDRAYEWLDKAEQISPDEKLVIGHQFDRLTAEKNFDRMRELVERARKVNADGVNGLTYRAQLELTEDRLSDAAATMQRALEEDPLNPAVWTALGRVQLVLKKYADAEAAFERSLDLRPNHVPSIVGLIRAKGLRGRDTEALEIARENRTVGRVDPEFLELWLMLETQVPGGNSLAALRTRTAMYERNPGNLHNNRALARLLIKDDRWDESKDIIDGLMEQQRTLEHVDLLARWHAKQGQLDEAADLFMNFAGDHPEGTDEGQIFSVAAQLFVEAGRSDIGLDILEQGRDYQDPEEMSCDRDRAELLFSLRRFEEARDVYRDLVANVKSDKKGDMELRLIETHILLEDWDAADEALASVGAAADRQARYVLLRAEVAKGRGDRATAARMYDEAVKLDPTLPSAYISRAQFNMVDPELFTDVEADLKQATRLAPEALLPRVMLVELYERSTRWDDAVEMLKKTLREEPSNDTLRVRLADILIGRGRGPEAMDALREGVNREPDNLQLARLAGERAAAIADWKASRDLHGHVWERKKNPQTAAFYAKSLLAGGDPQLERASEVLASPEAKTDEQAPTLLLRAAAHQAAGRTRFVRDDLEAAYALIDVRDQTSVSTLFRGLDLMFPQVEDRIRAMRNLQPDNQYRGWVALGMADLLATLPEYREDAVDLLTRFPETTNIEMLKYAAFKTLGQYQYTLERYDDAVSSFSSALELAPNDPELLNNIAYTVGTNLGRPQEALPTAERAAELAPKSANVLDTLGTIHLKLGERKKAIEVLTRGADAAQDIRVKAAIYAHLVEAYIEEGNEPEARRYMDLLVEIDLNAPEALAQHREEFERFRRELNY